MASIHVKFYFCLNLSDHLEETGNFRCLFAFIFFQMLLIHTTFREESSGIYIIFSLNIIILSILIKGNYQRGRVRILDR